MFVVFDSLPACSIDLVVCLVVRSLFVLLAGSLLTLMFFNCEDHTPFAGGAERPRQRSSVSKTA